MQHNCMFGLFGAFLAVVASASSGTTLPYEALNGSPYKVSYDHRAVTINGQRQMLLSGSIHYPRSTPDMWPGLISRSKAGGLNTIETYVFWNYHEAQRRQYDFKTGNRDLLRFLQAAQDQGMFVILRIGPYVCAEWSYGGFPTWLRDQPGMVFRTYNQLWMQEMQTFVQYVVQLVEPYMPRNGGPIILMQIENEYGNVEEAYGTNGTMYMKWAAQLTTTLGTDVPWIMCAQDDAPNIVINTCNGFYCHDWLDPHFKAYPDQPAMWTENWPGWFQHWGEPVPTRPVEDCAYAMLRWIAGGGTHHNWYMWHGGTNFGRTVGGPNIITSYDYDVALNEYGLPHNPKYSHSAAMHNAIMTYSAALLNNEPAPAQSLGPSQEARVYGQLGTSGSVAFLINWDTKNGANVNFAGRSFSIPAWSVSIVDGGQYTVVYNSATIHTDKGDEPENTTPATEFAMDLIQWAPDRPGGWSPSGSPALISRGPAELINVTKDASDYLWYTTSVNITQQQIQQGSVQLGLSAAQDYLSVYLDGKLVLTHAGVDSYQEWPIDVSTTWPGTHQLAILCGTVGYINYGKFLERYQRGLRGIVKFGGSDITYNLWNHWIGLQGECLQYYTPDGSRKAPWDNNWQSHSGTPLSWFQMTFNFTSTDPSAVWAISMSGMTKGQAWINGNHIGRYWNIVAAGICTDCDYRGEYNPDTRCRTGCGQPSQRYYHVPKAWLQAGDNVLVVAEEGKKWDPSKVKLVQQN